MNDAIWLGAFAGCGATGMVVLASTMLRARPRLADAIVRMTTPPPAVPESNPLAPDDFKSRVGAIVQPGIPRRLLAGNLDTDLRLLRIPEVRHLGDKTVAALLGAGIPVLGAAGAAQLGMSVGWALPALVAATLGMLLFLAPDLEVRRRAALARREFAEHLQVYLDLVALNRVSGVGAMQSLERAALVGDSWVFRQLSEVLQRAQLAGQPPWSAMADVAEQLAIPQLADLGDIMTVSGESGASIVDSLRARSRAQRHDMITAELGDAEVASEKLRIPNAGMAIVLVAIVIVPAVVNVMSG